jgi:2,4-diketo-3-deoxy-L-fuconate hydrolase
MSLHTEHLISTATPPGVGHGQMPSVSLRAGNDVRLAVDGLGDQRHSLPE